MRDIAALKTAVDLAVVVAETHPLTSGRKVHCPYHADRHPSCHIYRDGFKCFACGAHGDHLDWLCGVQGVSMGEAIERLEALARFAPPAPRRRRRRVRDRRRRVVTGRALASYRRRLERTTRLPRALAGRGLDLADARALGLAAAGDDALIPLRGPDGRLLAIKRRLAHPPRGGGRYLYETPGHGAPAWCSSGVRTCTTLLIVEGELNGMVSALALREAGARIGVMAPAGANGELHPEALAGRDVWLYADPDPAGDAARRRWRAQARRAGALSVTDLPPSDDGDACELAAAHGRPALAARWLAAMFGLHLQEAHLDARPDPDRLSPLPR